MNTKIDQPVFPVASFSTWVIPSVESFILQFRFLSHSLQRAEESQEARHYALTAVQLRELIASMQKGLAQLETAGVQPTQGQKH